MTDPQIWEIVTKWLFIAILIATPATFVYLILRDLKKKPIPPKQEETTEAADENDEPETPLY